MKIHCFRQFQFLYYFFWLKVDVCVSVAIYLVSESCPSMCSRRSERDCVLIFCPNAVGWFLCMSQSVVYNGQATHTRWMSHVNLEGGQKGENALDVMVTNSIRFSAQSEHCNFFVEKKTIFFSPSDYKQLIKWIVIDVSFCVCVFSFWKLIICT